MNNHSEALWPLQHESLTYSGSWTFQPGHAIGLDTTAVLKIRTPANRAIHASFLKHEWSGRMLVKAAGQIVDLIDLYAATPTTASLCLYTPAPDATAREIVVEVSSVSKRPASRAAQIVFHGIVDPTVEKGPPRASVQVVTDEELRKSPRTSLNRICTISDWDAQGPLSPIMRELHSPVVVHRKPWEYAMCIHGLKTLGRVRPDSVGLAVGAGSESPLYYFANTISEMVATDLYDNPTHEGTPQMLTSPETFAPFPYRRDHLKVLAMDGSDLKFADDTFDFCFCLSSIEHFPGRALQRKALDEMSRVLKPGGVAAIATELILGEGSHPEYFRLDELDTMFLQHPVLHLAGGELDLRVAQSLMDHPCDLDRETNFLVSPHIVLKRDQLLWASVMLFLRKPE